MIINCKCKKYAFNIPDDVISKEGRVVQCGFCDEQWLQKSIEKEDVSDMVLNSEIPIPIKNTNQIKKNITSKRGDNFYSTIFTLLLFILALVAGVFFNRNLILLNFPFLSGFFEASDIVKEIIMQIINWATEFAQNLFK